MTYERRVVDLPIKDVGEFACEKCGAVLESWRGRLAPTFKRTEPPRANH